jgi:ABC-2 type transport system permease protein
MTVAPRAPSFLASAWFIARADVLRMLRQRETALWVFAMPILYFYFVGTVTGGFGGPAGERHVPLAVRGGEQGGVLVDEILRRLTAQHFDIIRPATPEALDKVDLRLTIPFPTGGRSFTEAVLAGDRQVLTFEHRGDAVTANYDQLRVARAVYEVVADVAVVRRLGTSPTTEAFAQIAAMPRALTIASRPAGRRREPPSGYAQAVPGNMVMFTMLVLLTSGAINLVVERRLGLLRRLASAPMSAGSVVLGKWIGRMILGLVQLGFAMAAGTILFQLDWGRTLPMVALVLAAWASLAASLSILLASLMRTEPQTIGVAVISSMVFGALGGCWWPIEITPAWMQTLSLAFPTGWAMAALHKLVNFGDPALSTLPHVAALTVCALVVGALAARAFRFE